MHLLVPGPVRRLASCGALIALLLAGFLSPASAASRPTVSGRVVDENGDPAAGILVAVVTASEMWAGPASIEGEGRQSVTDAEGRFELAAPTDEGYLVRACPLAQVEDQVYCPPPEEAPSHLRAYRNLTTQTTSWVAQPSLIPAASSAQDVGTIRLEEPSRIRGRLTHANIPDKPWLPSELVVLRRMDGTQVGYRFLTDETYDFMGLAPGQYRVESHMTQLRPTRFLSDVITLGPAETRQVDATLEEPATLTGTVTSGGRAVKGQQVRVLEGRDEVVSGVTDQKGRYSVKVPHGGTFSVRNEAAESPYLPARATVEVASGQVARRDLRLVKGATVTVRVSHPARTGVRDRLRDARGRSVRIYGAEGGTIVYRGLAKGRYTLTAVSGARYERRSFRISSYRSYDLGRLKLTRRTLTLSGTTLPHALVELYDRRDLGREAFENALPESPNATSRGRYRVTGLVPGEYQVLLRTPAGSRSAPRVVKNVRIARDVRKDLPMPRGAAVTGRLVRDGTAFSVPLAVQAVHTGENRRYQYQFGINDVSGRFVTRGLMAGQVDVTTNVSEGAQHDYWEVGTPYFFSHRVVRPTLRLGETTDVGTVALTLGGGPVPHP